MDALYVVISDCTKVNPVLIKDEKGLIGLCYQDNGKDPFETTNLEEAKRHAIELEQINIVRYPGIEYKVCKCIPIEMIGE